jgi:hypothetical protein
MRSPEKGERLGGIPASFDRYPATAEFALPLGTSCTLPPVKKAREMGERRSSEIITEKRLERVFAYASFVVMRHREMHAPLLDTEGPERIASRVSKTSRHRSTCLPAGLKARLKIKR